MTSNNNNPKILLFPFLAHGHITPFFEVAKTLMNHNFIVYLCSTPVNLKFFAAKFATHSIKPVEFHIQPSAELPPHYHTTTGLPPHLIPPLINALEASSHTFSNILESVQPDLVIYDLYQSWLPDIAESHGVPAVYFQTVSAANFSHFLHSMKLPGVEFPFAAIYKTEYENASLRRVRSPAEDVDREVENFMKGIDGSNEMILLRSSRAFEEKYIDLQASLEDKNMVCVGSLVSEPRRDLDESEIIQWLDGKEEGSVLYISFGSEIYLSKEEVEEIALGLEMSNVSFIWVVRSSGSEKDKVDLDEVMPEGFLERIKGRGYIERVWAPQANILTHPSCGGFVTHCGWGSIVESITFGVPIIAMPMQYDQFLNARLVVELGVGLEVAREENGERKREEIGRVIEEVVMKGEGESMRRKAKDLGKKVRVKSEEELDGSVQELREMCGKKKKNLH